MMMHGFGAFSWLGIILGFVVHVAFAVMVVLSAIWLYRSLFKKDTVDFATPEQILQQRYAKGELSLEDFQMMKHHLAE